MTNKEILNKINRDTIVITDDSQTPVLATPAAFVAGAVAGGKASAVLVGAAGVGAAIANANK